VPYEQLRAQLEERTSEVDALRSRGEALQAAHDSLHLEADAQLKHREAEVERLSRALAAAKQDDAPSRAAVQRMQSDLKQKDGRLRQLRAAIKALEGKLTELLRDKTDWCVP